MKRNVILLVVALVVVVMSLGMATAACDAGSVAGQVFAAAGGDPSGGQLTDVLEQVDAALAPVEDAAGQDIPVC